MGWGFGSTPLQVHPVRAVILVPWRSGDARREAIWAWTQPWWERLGYELFRVAHEGPEPFSRAWCLNEGARRAWPWDVALLIDADVVAADPAQVIHAVGRAWDTGRFTMAHTEGRDIDDKGTQLILEGRVFNWNRRVAAARPGCTSRINAVRADMFEALGGFDERFRGWGHEDVAFNAAAEKMAGPFERIRGVTWHLYHEPMLGRSRRTREWQAGRDLAKRYLEAEDWPSVQAILDERTEVQRYRPPTEMPAPILGAPVELVVLTSGRGEYLETTLASMDSNVVGNVAAATMFDDSGDPVYAAWLDEKFSERFTIVHHPTNLGYSKAMESARAYVAAHEGPEYVFWLEDDFTFRRMIELDQLATLLENRTLAQVALLRAPYYPREFEAGSIPDEHPTSYVHATFNGIRYLRHTRFYTSNPNLSRRSLFVTHPWPKGAHTESRYGKGLVAQGMEFAFLGQGEPDVDHIGEVRGGHGY